MSLTQQLKKAIRQSRLSRYVISKRTGIEQSALSRFMSGERGLTLESAEAICELLKLELCRKAKQRGK